MAAAVSTGSAMQFHQLVLGITICLSVAIPVVHSMAYDTCQSYPVNASVAVNAHNVLRSKVIPSSSNMRRMYWNNTLADIARERACQCSYNHYSNYRPSLGSLERLAVENQGIGTGHSTVTSIIKSWFSEGLNYDYYTKACYARGYSTCQHYIRMVWSKACEVGCAIAECSGLREHFHRFYGRGHSSNYDGPLYLLVCVYGAGYPENTEHMFYYKHPYRAGPPCRDCPPLYPLCQPNPFVSSEIHGNDELEVQGDSTTIYGGLCYNEREVCIGSDPHFAIRLPGGSLLCYTFQGMHGAIFNLLSNKQLQMNALFVPDDTAYNNTWLGSIGISVLDNGDKMTTLQFTADDGLVRIGERIQLDARTVKKLSFNQGKLTVLQVPSNHTPLYPHPRVRVEFIDSELDFTVRFAKNNHLDLYWHSIGLPFDGSTGIVGQFFRPGVGIDAAAQLLRIPGRVPVPVEQQDLWKFMEQSLHGDTKCWTSAYHSSQGAGIIDGTYKDYIVDDLLTVN